jgi:hypothetical protein
MDIRLLINDQPARLETIQLRGMNFGRSDPDFPVVTYILFVPLTYLCNQMAHFYRDFVLDDLEHGTADDRQLVLDMRKLGWPDLIWLVQIDQALFTSFVKRYLAFDFLSLIHEKFAQDSFPRYIINSVDDVHIVGTEIRFSGVALDVGQTEKAS